MDTIVRGPPFTRATDKRRGVFIIMVGSLSFGTYLVLHVNGGQRMHIGAARFDLCLARADRGRNGNCVRHFGVSRCS